MKLPPAYNPKDFESDIYQLWERSRVFEPKNSERGSDYFSMVVPPPNANANLHIGFGLTMAVEDAITRYNRLQGKATLFVPGADHAGFETQSVYEKQLAKEGKSRFDFSREELYDQIWSFVAQNRTNYEGQFRQLGASVDWSRYTFTLDEKIVSRANQTFKKLWDDGLIYRGERLVNFCTFHGTGFADIEVEHKEENGHLWFINYPLSSGGGSIQIATTRPETMFGDVAIAVNPSDKRYKSFIGKTARLPLTERELPIIADDMVDPTFGTGAVKITPAHDFNDYEVGQRHDLPMVTVIDHEGKMNHEVPEPFRGLKVDEARSAVVKSLKEQEYLEKVEDHKHSVGHCYKCGTVIQPLLREQWFVDMQPLAKPAITALEAGQIKFYPDSKRTQLIRYLQGLKDWNISRQIAWGIPIPAFRSAEEPDKWVFDERTYQQTIEVEGHVYERDPDVFDTWFSSSSWPYATLDYPDGDNFKQFYPLTLMETGGEILYPWVARMIMLGLYITGEIPFENVYIHGYVMAEDGSKMSKSIGNVVDAKQMMDKYGSDALRMGLLAGRVPGVNRPFDERRVEEARNLCNKLWNIARFSEQALSSAPQNKPSIETIADSWILNQLSKVVGGVEDDFANYRLGEAYDKIYHFIWDDLADWYLETSKVPGATNGSTLKVVLESTLKLAHPFAPFLTETIWQQLGFDGVLAGSNWPEISDPNRAQAAKFEQLMQIVTEARRVTADAGLSKPNLITADALALDNSELVERLCRVSRIKTGAGTGLRLNLTGKEIWLEADKRAVDSYRDLLKDRLAKAESSLSQLEARLANKGYLSKAPEKLVAETRAEAENQRLLKHQIESDLANL